MENLFAKCLHCVEYQRNKNSISFFLLPVTCPVPLTLYSSPINIPSPLPLGRWIWDLFSHLHAWLPCEETPKKKKKKKPLLCCKHWHLIVCLAVHQADEPGSVTPWASAIFQLTCKDKMVTWKDEMTCPSLYSQLRWR